MFLGAILPHLVPRSELLLESFQVSPGFQALPGDRDSPVCCQQACEVLARSAGDHGLLLWNFLGLCTFPKDRHLFWLHLSFKITLSRLQTLPVPLGIPEVDPPTKRNSVLGFPSALE